MSNDLGDISVEFKTIDGMFIKQIHLRRSGVMIRLHAHEYGHSTLLASGSIILWREDAPASVHTAPEVIFIPAGIRHQYQSRSANTVVYCLHNLHDSDVVRVLDREGLDEETSDEVA